MTPMTVLETGFTCAARLAKVCLTAKPLSTSCRDALVNHFVDPIGQGEELPCVGAVTLQGVCRDDALVTGLSCLTP